MKTISQSLAEVVYPKVEEFGKDVPKDSEIRKKYCTIVERLPVLVHNAGLIQALAFVRSKEEKAYDRLLEQLASVMGCSDSDELLKKCQKAEFQEYRYLTFKVNAALMWFKRFSLSILECKPKPGENGVTK